MYRRLCHGLMRAWIEAIERSHERDQGVFTGKLADPIVIARPTPVAHQEAAALVGTTSGVETSHIAEHMPVISSDGTQIGIVDHLDGPDKIKLAKNASPDGQHHYIPLTWVDHVDAHVHLNKAAAHVRANW